MLFHGIAWLLVTLSSPSVANAQSISREAHAPNRFGGIKWAPCKNPDYDSLQCATLAVPLNYTAGASTDTIDLQLTKFSALKKPSKGSILFNPGGPGEPGRGFIRPREYGQSMVAMTGGDHDLIGFDPRGTGHTLPFTCPSELSDDDVNVDTSSDRNPQSPTTPTSALEVAWAYAKEVARGCSRAMATQGELIGTTFVARDMMRIVDALNEDGLLRYWGFSYGTVLGATVAAMYPDRMDKVVLDGVVNLNQYWSGQTVDDATSTEDTIDGFFSSCVESLEYCSLATSGLSAIELRKQFDDYVKKIKITGGDDPSLSLTLSLMLEKTISDNLMYTWLWPTLASILAEDYELDRILGSEAPSSINALSGIRCADSAFRANETSEVLPMVNQIRSLAPTLSDVESGGVMGCSVWEMRAEERYTMPFANIITKNPILFIGNTYDPRTPLVSAQNASLAFPGSGLLTLDAYGHTSTSQPSLCVGRAVKAYFANGTLPEEGAVCQPSVPAFRDSREFTLEDVENFLDIDALTTDEGLLASWSQVGREMSRVRGLF